MERCEVLNIMDIPKSIRWILGGLNIATSITASTGNFLVIMVILSRRQLRTRPNSLICCLAVTDFSVGLVMQPLVSTQLFNEQAGRNCIVTYMLYGTGTLICGASSLILVLISYDRYLHLVKLQNYTKYMSKRKIIAILLFCCIIPAFNGCLVFKDTTRPAMHIMSVSALVLCTVALAFWNGRIYSFINNRSKIMPLRAARASKVAERMHLKRQSRLARTLLIIIGCFVICWAPFTVYTIYSTIFKMRGISVSKSCVYANSVHCVAFTFGLCNSSINPAIYFWRNQTLRAEAKKFTRIFLF